MQVSAPVVGGISDMSMCGQEAWAGCQGVFGGGQPSCRSVPRPASLAPPPAHRTKPPSPEALAHYWQDVHF